MKKYIKPIQRIYSVSTCEIIAGSPKMGIAGGDANIDDDDNADIQVKEEKGTFLWN